MGFQAMAVPRARPARAPGAGSAPQTRWEGTSVTLLAFSDLLTFGPFSTPTREVIAHQMISFEQSTAGIGAAGSW